VHGSDILVILNAIYIVLNYFALNKYIIVTEFWKITHMGAPETIRIFEFSMALLIVEITFKNISKLYL